MSIYSRIVEKTETDSIREDNAKIEEAKISSILTGFQEGFAKIQLQKFFLVVE
jgi:hypothetical protein